MTPPRGSAAASFCLSSSATEQPQGFGALVFAPRPQADDKSGKANRSDQNEGDEYHVHAVDGHAALTISSTVTPSTRAAMRLAAW